MGNDAIPSWSGFNYQGKMAILCALQEINKNNNVDEYSIELERQEDFAILNNDTTIALYQVKAVLSQKKHRYYTISASKESVAQKLIRHKAECGNYMAQCFLVSAIDIVDWNNKDNTYRNHIKLYQYNGETVSIVNCSNCIREEIKLYLTKCKETPFVVNDETVYTIYAKLCVFLESKVAMMHNQNSRDRNYRILLTDFVNVMKDTVISGYEQMEFCKREEIYRYLGEILSHLVPNYCENDCPENRSCNPECVIHRLEEEFSRLNDIRKYIEVINPGVNKWSEFDYVSHASIDALRKHIVYPFHCSRNADGIRRQHDGIIFESHLSQAKNKLVLPTLLSIGANTQRSLETTLQNIKNNIDIQPSIAGNTLLAAMDTDIMVDLQKDCICSRWTIADVQAIGNPYAGTEIVSEQRFLKELKNERH